MYRDAGRGTRDASRSTRVTRPRGAAYWNRLQRGARVVKQSDRQRHLPERRVAPQPLVGGADRREREDAVEHRAHGAPRKERAHLRRERPRRQDLLLQRARTPDKVERARDYGLEDGVALAGDLAPLAERVSAWTGGAGVDVVLDLVGGPYVRPSAAALALKGRLILIGTVAGGEGTIPLGRALSQRLTIRGTVLRSRPLEERILATRAFAAEVGPLLARHVVRPVIDTVFPLAEIRAAHERLQSNATFGKVVVEV